MKNAWHKITKITWYDFFFAMSILMLFVAWWYHANGEIERWKDFIINSFIFMMGASCLKIRQLREKINELEKQLAERKRGRYDQIALNRLRERNG